jgi:hypothetical protein
MSEVRIIFNFWFLSSRQTVARIGVMAVGGFGIPELFNSATERIIRMEGLGIVKSGKPVRMIRVLGGNSCHC